MDTALYVERAGKRKILTILPNVSGFVPPDVQAVLITLFVLVVLKVLHWRGMYANHYTAVNGQMKKNYV
jgi:hypothetical protein